MTITIIGTIILYLAITGACYGLFYAFEKHEQMRLVKSRWGKGIYKGRKRETCYVCDTKCKCHSYIVPQFHPVWLCDRCASEHGPFYVRICR